MTKYKQSRRGFLKTAGMGAAAFFVSGCGPDRKAEAASEVSQESGKKVPKAGLQLWTVREAIGSDLEGTLGRIAEMGYAGVETARLPEHLTHAQVGKVLKGLGLEVLAAHCEIPVGKEKDVWLEIVDAYGCQKMIWHGWPGEDRYASKENLERAVELYLEANAFAKAQGLQFGLHNHWWEFEEVEGIIPLYYLFENLGQDIFFEIDTYWVKTAGFDPAKVIADFGDRVPIIHIKDGPAPTGEIVRAQVPAGQGTLDFPAIARAGKSAQWMVVEFDACETDIMEAVHDSYRYLIRNGMARGSV